MPHPAPRPALVVFEVDIHDPEALKPYLEGVGATLAPFAPDVLVNSDAVVALEGEAPKGTVVMLRFDSIETARAWYHSPAYQAILGHRTKAATTRAFLAQGL